MTLLHYQTLFDGTLLDVEVRDGAMTLRAGRSLDPAERPEVLRLSFADWFDLVRVGSDLFVFDMDQRRQARVDLVAEARQAVIAGATHDCGEWLTDDVCALCGWTRPE